VPDHTTPVIRIPKRILLLLAIVAVALPASCAAGDAVLDGTTPPASTATGVDREEGGGDQEKGDFMNLTIGDTVWTATLAENSSAEALREMLVAGPVTIEMSDYASMEKVGPLGTTLPRNDEQITTRAGDLILYRGSELVIYYAPNSWSFTRLGRINDVTTEDLRATLGTGDVTVTLTLA
jgi:hypothetical protein